MNRPVDDVRILDDSSPPPCPRCGRPVIRLCLTGPTDRFAVPCGCRVSLADLDRE